LWKTNKFLNERNKLNVSNLNDVKSPLEFLTSVMNGRDPRSLSTLYELAVTINELSEGKPTATDWSEIYELIVGTCKYREVDLRESINASKTLSEYSHAKYKPVDKSDHLLTGNWVNEALTENEIALFKEKFNSEY